MRTTDLNSPLKLRSDSTDTSRTSVKKKKKKKVLSLQAAWAREKKRG